jgi:hypothetical protein
MKLFTCILPIIVFTALAIFVELLANNSTTSMYTAKKADNELSNFNKIHYSKQCLKTTFKNNQKLIFEIDDHSFLTSSIIYMNEFPKKEADTNHHSSKSNLKSVSRNLDSKEVLIDMYYLASNVTQASTQNVGRGDTKEPIIKLEITTRGTDNPLILNQIRMSYNGSNIYDISRIRIYYTGLTNNLDTSSSALFGTASPITGNITFNGNAPLQEGVNYFWITYDVAYEAIYDNYIDGQIIDFNTQPAITYTPTNTNPAGRRRIAQNDTLSINLWHQNKHVSNNWFGAKLDIYVNNSLVYDNLTLDSTQNKSFFVKVTNGDTIRATYANGTSENEQNYYSILNSSGKKILESGSARTIPIASQSAIFYSSHSPFIPCGGAFEESFNSKEFKLTDEINNQAGSVWYIHKLNLKKDFRIDFDLYLGNNNLGADGTVFVLKQSCQRYATTGQGMGFQNLDSASLGVEFDTYYNSAENDPSINIFNKPDHMSLFKNGKVRHGSANELTVVKTTVDLENNNWHPVTINWNATTKTFKAKLDNRDSISYTGNILDSIFKGDSIIYWGFTAATGDNFNIQKIRMNTYPTNTTQIPDSQITIGTHLTITAPSDGATYQWLPNDGTISNPTSQTTTFTPIVSTTYVLIVTDKCGYVLKDTFRLLIKGLLDIELLDYSVTCEDEKTIIKWTSASETNNKGFDIYRSQDALNFENIGFIKGAGNSSNTIDYIFIDKSTNSKTQYYKVIQTDFDGSQTTLFTEAISCNTPSNSVSIRPNPCTDFITISFTKPSNEQIAINVYGADSKLLHHSIFINNGNEFTLNMNTYPTGLYTIKITLPTRVYTFKVIKL